MTYSEQLQLDQRHQGTIVVAHELDGALPFFALCERKSGQVLESKISGGVAFKEVVLPKQRDDTRKLILLEETLAERKHVVRVT